ncbi:histidine kinase, partial [Pseudomonas sp. GW460-C3]
LGVPIDTPGDNTGVIPTITEPTVAEETSPNVDLPAGVLQDIADLPAETAMLIVRRGPNLGAQFLLDQDETTAGRSTHSDIFLDDITV